MKNKLFAMVPVLSLSLLLGACSEGATEDKKMTETKTAQVPEWENELKNIIKNYPEVSESKEEWIVEMMDVNRSTEFNEEEKKKYEEYMIKEFETGNYLNKSDDNEYMLKNVFLSEELSPDPQYTNISNDDDKQEDNAHEKFLRYFSYNTIGVFRGFTSSDKVEVYEEFMNEAIQEIR